MFIGTQGVCPGVHRCAQPTFASRVWVKNPVTAVIQNTGLRLTECSLEPSVTDNNEGPNRYASERTGNQPRKSMPSSLRHDSHSYAVDETRGQ